MKIDWGTLHVAGNGSVWLIGFDFYIGLFAAQWVNNSLGTAMEFSIPNAEATSTMADDGEFLKEDYLRWHEMAYFDSTKDSDGNIWVVWSDGENDNIIYTRCLKDGIWGPRLQVSRGGDVSPRILADDYGNVWLLWHREATNEIWMCRMGPRSGQETLVAKETSSKPLSIAIDKGVLYVTFLKNGQLHLVQGTEHQGFGPAIELGE